MQSPQSVPSAPSENADLDYEFVIIGSGVCGMFQLYCLLQLGVRVTVLELNGDVGGTWYRNRYPGCRFDSESYTYAYSFSDELLDEWDWSERFAPQGETLEYLRYVAEKFRLREHIKFNCNVRAAHFDDELSIWRVRTEDGREITTRFLMTAMGLLSVPTSPRLPGLERFQGEALHTFYWPEDGLDLTGKRVGVVGTGSTGVQVISTVAKDVAQLTVFQRDPSWCAPLHNAPLSKEEMADIRRNYDAIFEQCFKSPNGFIHRPLRQLTTDVSREERIKLWEELYDQPGFAIWLGNYRDTMMDEKANEELSEFIAQKVRSRVHSAEVADLLIPKDHGFGTKRVPLETGYYEVYNQDNVELVDVNEQPITEVTETGVRIRTPEGSRHIELDVLVFATGFDAVTGAFDRIEFIGANGVRLKDKWADGPTTYMGVQVTDFPNLLTCVGPQSGSVAANFPRGIEDIVAWMTEFSRHLIENDVIRVVPTHEAEAGWVEHVADINSKVLMSKTRSWFTGHNVNLDRDDRPRHMIYTGGAVRYRRILTHEADAGYPNFVMTVRDPLAVVQAAGV